MLKVKSDQVVSIKKLNFEIDKAFDMWYLRTII